MKETVNNKALKDRPGTSIGRKEFLKRSAISIAGLSSLSTLFGFSFEASDKQKLLNTKSSSNGLLRTIEYNVFNGCIIYKGINGYKLPDTQKYDLVRLARDKGQGPKRIALQLALYNPNIISLCEAPVKDVVALMANWLGMNYAFFPSLDEYKGVGFPGAIMTQYKIVNFKNRPFIGKGSKDLFTRHWGKAEIRLPNDELIIVHSCHFWPFSGEKNRKIRLRETEALLKSIHFDLAHNTKSVILQGDLNHTPDEPVQKKLLKGGLVDMFEKVGHGNGYTHSSIKPTKRIDYIFGIGPIAKKMESCRPLFEGDFRMNTNDTKAFALSDHIPVLGDFEM